VYLMGMNTQCHSPSLNELWEYSPSAQDDWHMNPKVQQMLVYQL